MIPKAMNKKGKLLIFLLVCAIAAQSIVLFITFRSLNSHIEEEKRWMSFQLSSAIDCIDLYLEGDPEYADDIYSSVYNFYILYDTSYKKNHDNLVKIHLASLRLFSKYPIVEEEYLLLKAALEKILEDIDSSEGFLLLEQFYTYSDIGLH